MLRNILVRQSAGLTNVINASLYGIIKESKRNSEKFNKLYGMVNRIEWFLKDNIIDFEKYIPEIEYLKMTPAAFLGSCRYKLLDNFNDNIYIKLFSKLKKMNIKYVLYIGGNDSMDTVHKLFQYSILNWWTYFFYWYSKNDR